MTPVEVLGVDHIDLTVTDMDRAAPFYDRVLGALGFSRVQHQSYVAWSNGLMTIGLRAAIVAHHVTPFDRYRSGLHHLALKARSREQVDGFYQFLCAEGVTVLDPPREYPEYGPAYYAVFFADPDGVKLELVHFPWGYWRTVQTEGRDERPRYVPRTVRRS